MCGVCGCGAGEVRIEGRGQDALLPGRYRPVPQRPGLLPVPGRTGGRQGERTRRLRVERDILAVNDAEAGANRRWLAERHSLALNLVSSPGAGKTSLLVRTVEALWGRWPMAVIEGDQQTSFDAERIRATGVPAVQINTGKGCHLDARMVARALPGLLPAGGGLLFIENVGNLVCPAAFDLGEAAKVVVLSVTEGDDKPLKYPDMFAAARLMLLNKTDLLPYVDFSVERALEFARRINPQLEVLLLSARTGEGMDAWLAWLEARAAEAGVSGMPGPAGQEVLRSCC
ncbi:hydrogenase nickel incorporation protein HypB [Zoogloea sp.]|uniref:hydrogenase nickel incorporation protein HypB n=1 Tax=Zoogloea sp. TaxID=49181 RepID=UPI001415C181|nr:MAG: hydrogenase nickel incorporation protein HypB [Zoogloea sp.]